MNRTGNIILSEIRLDVVAKNPHRPSKPRTQEWHKLVSCICIVYFSGKAQAVYIYRQDRHCRFPRIVKVARVTYMAWENLSCTSWENLSTCRMVTCIYRVWLVQITRNSWEYDTQENLLWKSRPYFLVPQMFFFLVGIMSQTQQYLKFFWRSCLQDTQGGFLILVVFITL